jgi:hypothetical protein
VYDQESTTEAWQDTWKTRALNPVAAKTSSWKNEHAQHKSSLAAIELLNHYGAESRIGSASKIDEASVKPNQMARGPGESKPRVRHQRLTGKNEVQTET